MEFSSAKDCNLWLGKDRNLREFMKSCTHCQRVISPSVDLRTPVAAIYILTWISQIRLAWHWFLVYMQPLSTFSALLIWLQTFWTKIKHNYNKWVTTLIRFLSKKETHEGSYRELLEPICWNFPPYDILDGLLNHEEVFYRHTYSRSVGVNLLISLLDYYVVGGYDVLAMSW